MAVCGFAGLLISYTARNMGGTYWGIATLAVGEIVRLIFLNENWLAGGANGISLKMRIPYFEILISLFYGHGLSTHTDDHGFALREGTKDHPRG